jgi:hypothetical protein
MNTPTVRKTNEEYQRKRKKTEKELRHRFSPSSTLFSWLHTDAKDRNSDSRNVSLHIMHNVASKTNIPITVKDTIRIIVTGSKN